MDVHATNKQEKTYFTLDKNIIKNFIYVAQIYNLQEKCQIH